MNADSMTANRNSKYGQIPLVQPHWGWFLGLGIVLMVLGVVAMAAPVAATLAAELVFGWLLIISGVAHGVHAAQTRSWKGFIWQVLLGVLSLAVGVLLLLYPLQGVITLTLVLALYFIAEGIAKIIMAVQIRSMPNWGWLLTSGLLALVLGALIWLQLPGAAAWVIGFLVGIDLVFSGIALVMLALAWRGRLQRATG